MLVVFLHGPAAAGKYTVGSRLSERTGLPLFHNHLTVDLAKTLFAFGSESFGRLRAGIWRLSFAEAASAQQSFIFTFHPEATVERSLIDDLVGTIEASGGTVCFVELRCSEDTILERLGDTSRARFGKLTDPDLYREVAQTGGFDFPAMPQPIVVIDTEALSPEDAAIRIEAALAGPLVLDQG